MGAVFGNDFLPDLGRALGRILAHPTPGGDPNSAQALLHGRGLAIHHTIDAIGVQVLHFPETPGQFQGHVNALVNSGLYDFAEGDFIGRSAAVVPNDPFLTSQFYIGRCKFDSPLDSLGAWDITTGNPAIIIAVLDSGIDLTHPDLVGKTVPGFNFVLGNTNVQDDGCETGHGTAVSGVCAAATNNAIGIAGCGFNCRIMPLVTTSAACLAYWSDVANACVYAADHGANVINLSVAGATDSSTLEAGLLYAFNKGIMILGAAGNAGTTVPYYPARSPYCVSVGAVDQNDVLASFSERGSAVDLYAPGTPIFTTVLGGKYGSWYGTSFSTPMVTAAVALALSANPTLKQADLKTLLLANCDTVNGLLRLNARLFVAAAAAAVPTPDVTPPVISITAPAGGATLAGTVSLTGVVTDNIGVVKTELYIDGVLKLTTTVNPNYSFQINTTLLTNAAHTLLTKAYDAAGNTATASINVTVNNSVLVKPTISITSPTNGSTVHGNNVQVNISATDPSPIKAIALLVDGASVGTQNISPVSTNVSTTIRWSIRNVASGSHALQAIATDINNNTAVSTVITVTR